MDPLPSKAISSMPELASRTPFAFVVDSLLVRATDYCVGHRDRQNSMLLHKFQYLPGDYGVGANVPAVHFPVAQLFHLCILGWHDADCDLGCLAQIWTVERDSSHWPTPHSLPGFLAQALKESILHHHMAPSATFAFMIALCDPPGCRESIGLERQFPGFPGACLANRPAGHSPLPSRTAGSSRPSSEASTADRTAPLRSPFR